MGIKRKGIAVLLNIINVIGFSLFFILNLRTIKKEFRKSYLLREF